MVQDRSAECDALLVTAVEHELTVKTADKKPTELQVDASQPNGAGVGVANREWDGKSKRWYV